jgi:hypothetical protein
VNIWSGFFVLRCSAFAKRSSLARYLRLFALIGLFASTARANVIPIPTGSIHPHLSFAFSDFDGDLRPDSVVVHAGRSGSGWTEYWIVFRFAAGEIQAFHVIGKSGGVQLAARDVNGDQAPDVIVTTEMYREPIAVLLNDGHGGFSQTDVDAYAGALSNANARWSFWTAIPQQLLDLLPRSEACGHSSLRTRSHPSSFRRSCSVLEIATLERAQRFPPLRAPPSSVITPL